jgi:hypothetical protein
VAIEVVEWRSFQRNTLLGFAKIRVPEWRLTFDGIAIHEKNGKRWAQLPSKPVLDANRELVKESDGKLRYAKVIEFDDREISTRFSDAVVKAVEHHIAAQAFAP